MTPYAHPEVLVETSWLMNHLNDPQVRVVAVDMSPDPYQNAHIPGAIFWNIFADLLQPDLSMNLDPTAMAKLLSRSGVTPETTVIAYGSYPGTGAWIFWLLKLFGHDNVYVLNGGHQKWVAEGRPLTAELANFAPTQYQAKSPNPTLRVLQAEVQAALAQPNCVVLDVRTAEEYRGDVFMMKPSEGDERGGHIAGAIHLEHTLTLNDDGTFKSADELKALYSSQGITADKVVFPYCAIGGRSAYTWFVLTICLAIPKCATTMAPGMSGVACPMHRLSSNRRVAEIAKHHSPQRNKQLHSLIEPKGESATADRNHYLGVSTPSERCRP